MADTRSKDVAWTIHRDAQGFVSHDDARLAVFMDLRDELKALNVKMGRLVDILNCQNFLDIPHTLTRISRNTAKPKVKK